VKSLFVSLLLSSFALSGCVTTETHYKTINGMAYCENCKAVIVTSSETEKIKLPGGGYAGATVDLGSIEKTATRGDVSKTLAVVNQAIVGACEGQKSAAFSNDRTAYDKWAAIQQNQIAKLEQLEGIMASGESSSSASPTPTATPAAAEAPAAVAEASPTPAPKKDAQLKKWASVYSPKNKGKVKLPAGTKVAATAPSAPAAASGTAPTPPVVTPAVKAVLETQPKYPQVLGLPAK
jgi:hypothetical protein